MNLRDIHYILAVAEKGNFKLAADACHVTQPTLSMQIKKLENELGLRVFERTNKSVMLTEAGHRIIEAARRLTEYEGQIRDIARMARDPGQGDFRFGAIPTLASYVFPTYVPMISKAFPKLKLFLLEEKTEILLEKIGQGKIDAALLALPIHNTALASAPLFDDPFLLAVNAKHHLAKRKAIRADDLTGHHLLLLDEGHCLRDQALSVCHARGLQEEEAFRATSLETLRLMVEAQPNFVTLMPAIAASKQSKGALRYIPFSGDKPSRQIGLVWRKTSTRSEIIESMAILLAKTGTSKP